MTASAGTVERLPPSVNDGEEGDEHLAKCSASRPKGYGPLISRSVQARPKRLTPPAVNSGERPSGPSRGRERANTDPASILRLLITPSGA